MKKLFTLAATALFIFAASMPPADAALGNNALRTMMRNNTNTSNLNQDITNPGVNALLGYDVSSTLGRIDGGSGAFQVFLLGSGLSYDSPTSTLSVVSGISTFGAPSRALNNCFQIDAAKDADFHYKVDVTTALSLTTGAQGTVTATSYTNSACTTGATAEADGTSAQTGALVVGLGISQVVSVPLDGTLQGGKWLKLTTANTVGTPTFAIRTVQREIVQP